VSKGRPPIEALQEADRLLSEGDYQAVLSIVEGTKGVVVAPDTRAELCYLAALAAFNLELLSEAERYLGEALALAETADYQELSASIALEKADFQAALASADRAIALEPDFADAYHARGVALTLVGRLEEADGESRRAAQLEPEVYFVPFRLRSEEFDRAVEEALALIPEPFRRHLENVEVAVEEVPARELIEEGLGAELLGLYQGDTIHAGDWSFPDRIILYQRSLENVSPDRRTLIQEIRDTVLHEVGHHLGMEEEALEAIEAEEEET